MEATASLDCPLMHVEERPPFHKATPSWTAVAGMLLSVMMPVCGWMVSLSNRVAVLEEKTTSLATAAQIAEVKQKIDDWIAASERDRVNERVRQNRTEGK